MIIYSTDGKVAFEAADNPAAIAEMRDLAAFHERLMRPENGLREYPKQFGLATRYGSSIHVILTDTLGIPSDIEEIDGTKRISIDPGRSAKREGSSRSSEARFMLLLQVRNAAATAEYEVLRECAVQGDFSRYDRNMTDTEKQLIRQLIRKGDKDKTNAWFRAVYQAETFRMQRESERLAREMDQESIRRGLAGSGSYRTDRPWKDFKTFLSRQIGSRSMELIGSMYDGLAPQPRQRASQRRQQTDNNPRSRDERGREDSQPYPDITASSSRPPRPPGWNYYKDKKKGISWYQDSLRPADLYYHDPRDPTLFEGKKVYWRDGTVPPESEPAVFEHPNGKIGFLPLRMEDLTLAPQRTASVRDSYYSNPPSSEHRAPPATASSSRPSQAPAWRQRKINGVTWYENRFAPSPCYWYDPTSTIPNGRDVYWQGNPQDSERRRTNPAYFEVHKDGEITCCPILDYKIEHVRSQAHSGGSSCRTYEQESKPPRQRPDRPQSRYYHGERKRGRSSGRTSE